MTNYSQAQIEDYTYDVFIEDEFDEEDLEPVYDAGTPCKACFGTGLDRELDSDCLTCWGDGVV